MRKTVSTWGFVAGAYRLRYGSDSWAVLTHSDGKLSCLLGESPGGTLSGPVLEPVQKPV